jgi:two-component system NtrC family sensor kinase
MEKMASLGELAATVAHELNNPLAGILNYARLVERTLAEGEPSAEERQEMERFLGVIQKEAGRCGDIVRNLLLFARRSGSEMKGQPLAPILERALMITRHHLEMAGVACDADLDAAAGLELVCDGSQLEQALVALIVNAVEAMADGGTLSVSAQPADGGVELVVADTGSGIASDDLPHIFEPFYSTKTGKNGVGLGLSVVYGIVTRHGGTIDVDSRPGAGTRFRIRLPQTPPAAAKGEEQAGVGSGERGQA